jgi:tetratricopeptide (TPR) repeat protein
MKDLLDLPPPRRQPGMKQSYKTLLLWTVLIVMFLAVYQFLSPPAPHAPTHHDPPASSLADYASWIVGLLVLLPAIAWGLRTGRINKRFAGENATGIALLDKGLYTQAAAHFEGLLQRYRLKGLRATARHNVATARLALGELDRAIELYTSVATDPSANSWHANVWNELASTCALAGRLSEAAAWLAKVETVPNVNAFSLVWPRTLLAARRGELSELERMLETRWRELEGKITAVHMRRLLLLRAFSVATAEGPRGTASAEPLLARLRPTTPGEFDWMLGGWPELGAFVAGHNL